MSQSLCDAEVYTNIFRYDIRNKVNSFVICRFGEKELISKVSINIIISTISFELRQWIRNFPAHTFGRPCAAVFIKSQGTFHLLPSGTDWFWTKYFIITKMWWILFCNQTHAISIKFAIAPASLVVWIRNRLLYEKEENLIVKNDPKYMTLPW